ncbi:MAG: tetratricopeptide repeat protein [bacterium]|nr:tetratricopeptide repeat protein [bacterium]
MTISPQVRGSRIGGDPDLFGPTSQEIRGVANRRLGVEPGSTESSRCETSKRNGYEIRLPENTDNQFGYALFRAETIDEAIQAFEENAKLDPNSDNDYDSLTEALEKRGIRSKALANY